MSSTKGKWASPANAAESGIDLLARLYADWFPPATREDFIEEQMVPMVRDPASMSGDALLESFYKKAEARTVEVFDLMQIACAYYVEAMRAESDGDLGEAWSLALEGAYWLGNVQGYAAKGWEAQEEKRKAATARHAENHAMKADVIAWYSENMTSFKSIEGAAEAIAGKIVPAKFRTVRDWIAEWKKMQSARKP